MNDSKWLLIWIAAIQALGWSVKSHKKFTEQINWYFLYDPEMAVMDVCLATDHQNAWHKFWHMCQLPDPTHDLNLAWKILPKMGDFVENIIAGYNVGIGYIDYDHFMIDAITENPDEAALTICIAYYEMIRGKQ